MEPMHKINKVELRSLQLEDYTQLSQSFKRVYADKDVFWTRKQIEDVDTDISRGTGRDAGG